jgi:hypothetical protein
MYNEKVNMHRIAFAAMAAIMLLTTTVVSMATTQNAFAYSKTQAASQANDCGNGDFPFDVFCQNLASQIQGDNNAPALAASQGAQEEAPPIPVEQCIECLAPLIDTGVAIEIAEDMGLGVSTTDEAAIDAICDALASGIRFGEFARFLGQHANELPPGTVGEINSCLRPDIP